MLELLFLWGGQKLSMYCLDQLYIEMNTEQNNLNFLFIYYKIFKLGTEIYSWSLQNSCAEVLSNELQKWT